MAKAPTTLRETKAQILERAEREMRQTLGDHLLEHFAAAKREEWLDYIKHVSPWETDRYLGMH